MQFEHPNLDKATHVFYLGRNGINAASADISKHLGGKGRLGVHKSPKNSETGPIGTIAGQVKEQPATGESLLKDTESWMESLSVPEEYVDYGAVAKERVSAARRIKRSDLKRGPACPVCSG